MSISRRQFLKLAVTLVPAAALAGINLPETKNATLALWHRDNSGWNHHALMQRQGEITHYVNGMAVDFASPEGSYTAWTGLIKLTDGVAHIGFWNYALSPAEILAVAAKP